MKKTLYIILQTEFEYNDSTYSAVGVRLNDPTAWTGFDQIEAENKLREMNIIAAKNAIDDETGFEYYSSDVFQLLTVQVDI